MRRVLKYFQTVYQGRHARDHMVVGFITTYAITAYHHWSCEFEPRSGEVYSKQYYVIKFVSDLRQVGAFLWELLFSPPIKLTAMIWLKYCWKPNSLSFWILFSAALYILYPGPYVYGAVAYVFVMLLMKRDQRRAEQSNYLQMQVNSNGKLIRN